MLILFYCAALSLKIAVSFSHITGHEKPRPRQDIYSTIQR